MGGTECPKIVGYDTTNHERNACQGSAPWMLMIVAMLVVPRVDVLDVVNSS
jgi:hypothetical protein